MSGVAVKALILTIKTVSKPVSKRLKSQAEASERFRDLCITVGRFMNEATHLINVRLAGGRELRMKPLGEQEAVSRGAEVVGEAFVYATSVLLLVGEYARRDYIKDLESNEKARKKQQRRKAKDADLREKFAAMQAEIDTLREELRELRESSKSVTSKIRDVIIPSLSGGGGGATDSGRESDEKKKDTAWFDGTWLSALSPFYFHREEQGQEINEKEDDGITDAGVPGNADSEVQNADSLDIPANAIGVENVHGAGTDEVISPPRTSHQQDAEVQIRLLKKMA